MNMIVERPSLEQEQISGSLTKLHLPKDSYDPNFIPIKDSFTKNITDPRYSKECSFKNTLNIDF